MFACGIQAVFWTPVLTMCAVPRKWRKVLSQIGKQCGVSMHMSMQPSVFMRIGVHAYKHIIYFDLYVHMVLRYVTYI
jgi:hypothetical protein